MFGDNIMESKLEAIMALTALLQGPLEVGNTILAREGVLEILLAMADSGDIIHTVSTAFQKWTMYLIQIQVRFCSALQTHKINQQL